MVVILCIVVFVEFERNKKRSSPHVYTAWTNAGRVHRGLASAPTPLAIMFDRAWHSVGDEFRSGVKVIRCYYATANNNIADPNGGPISPHSSFISVWYVKQQLWGKQKNMNIIQVPLFPSKKTKQLQGRSCIMLREYMIVCVCGLETFSFSARPGQ